MDDWLSRLTGSRRLSSEQRRQLKIKILCLLILGCVFLIFAIFAMSEGTVIYKTPRPF